MSASSPDSPPSPDVSAETTPPETAPVPAEPPPANSAPPPKKPQGIADPHHGHGEHHPTHYWLWVMCLTGVDYFSTLAYQPSIAFAATGRLMPLATLVLVMVTLFGALPIYRYVMRESPHGQGSIAMLERLVSGWSGKLLVLVLLGFAVTDFVITKTLSAADAAEHLVHNPNWPWPVSNWEEAHDTPNAEALGSDGNVEGVPTLPTTPPPSAHETVKERVESGTGEAKPSFWLLKQHLFLTLGMLVLLGAIFLRGFQEVIFVAVAIVGVYLVLNLVVILSGLAYVAQHREVFDEWWRNVQAGEWAINPEELAHFPISGHGPTAMILFCLILFPKLALGLSGFETGAAVMPLVKGDDDDDPRQPAGRIRNARKLLVTAALIMSFFLITSSWVVCLLIRPSELGIGGAAENRALAFLAHGQSHFQINPLFGSVFGTIYDLSTVLILWFAGASAMSGLLNLIPRYLPRYGMAPAWASALQPMVIVFTVINLFVTWIFDANVLAQGGAYATGVMVLISSACVAGVIDKWRRHSDRFILFRIPWMFIGITIVFFLTTLAIIIEKPEGLPISACFITSIIVLSLVSRVVRSTELRYANLEFIDERSRMLWDELKYLSFPVLVPHRPGGRGLADKEWRIRRDHRLPESVPVVFLEVSQGDVSEFYSTPLLEVTQLENRFVVRLTRCASIAHAIAAVSLELSKTGEPPELHFGWSDESPISVSVGFVLFGEGNVPWLVRELIRKAEPEESRRPRVVIG